MRIWHELIEEFKYKVAYGDFHDGLVRVAMRSNATLVYIDQNFNAKLMVDGSSFYCKIRRGSGIFKLLSIAFDGDDFDVEVAPEN